MSKLPLLKARELVKILTTLGFSQTRQRGSHAFFLHPDGRTTVVPIHPAKQIGKGLLRSILHDIQISPEEFKKLT
jgi:predicted RNA binding protein YcfA (HicA-like mRNA interferase family)